MTPIEQGIVILLILFLVNIDRFGLTRVDFSRYNFIPYTLLVGLYFLFPTYNTIALMLALVFLMIHQQQSSKRVRMFNV